MRSVARHPDQAWRRPFAIFIAMWVVLGLVCSVLFGTQVGHNFRTFVIETPIVRRGALLVFFVTVPIYMFVMIGYGLKAVRLQRAAKPKRG